jgi:hypothetical protein
MDSVQKTLLQMITHHRQNPLDFKKIILFLLVANVTIAC